MGLLARQLQVRLKHHNTVDGGVFALIALDAPARAASGGHLLVSAQGFALASLDHAQRLALEVTLLLLVGLAGRGEAHDTQERVPAGADGITDRLADGGEAPVDQPGLRYHIPALGQLQHSLILLLVDLVHSHQLLLVGYRWGCNLFGL